MIPSLITDTKNPALNNAGLQIGLKWFGSLLGCPSCLAGYFTWPQVALTHHAFRRWLYASQTATVKFCCSSLPISTFLCASAVKETGPPQRRRGTQRYAEIGREKVFCF